MFDFDRLWPKKVDIHFIHNWRCAGTSINSLLSANFHKSYLKIGHPFTDFGWPEDYQSHREPYLTSSQLRNAKKSLLHSHVVVGGHTYNGLQAFIPGSWHLWTNYRDPIARLNSGLLRFYSRKLKRSQASHGHLVDKELSQDQLSFTDPHSVDLLLETVLLRESNGISRRLAGLATKPNFTFSEDDNIETVDLLSLYRYDSRALLDNAINNLNSLDLVLNSEYFFESVLCIESFYNLASPLINPFSNLRHNPVELGGNKNDKRLLEHCKHILHKHTAIDRKLLPHLNHKFSSQVNTASITTESVAVRKLIHSSPLFDSRWFNVDGSVKSDKVFKLVQDSIVDRYMVAGELGDHFLNVILSWAGWHDQLRIKL